MGTISQSPGGYIINILGWSICQPFIEMSLSLPAKGTNCNRQLREHGFIIFVRVFQVSLV